MKKASICFVNTSKTWGGGEKWHATAAVLCSQDANVSLIAKPQSELANKLTNTSVQIKSINITNKSFLNPYKIWQLYRFYKKNNFHSVVLNLPADVKCAGIAAKLAGIKKIIYRRGMPHPIRDTVLNRFLFGKVVTNVIVNSEEIGRSIVKNNPNIIPKDKITIIYNGIDIEDFDPTHSPSLEHNNDSIILGTTGRCVEQKNQLMLIHTLKELRQRGYKIKLQIAGAGYLLESLKNKIKELQLESDVTLLGFVEDTRATLAGFDIFLFPSHYEGSANAIIEAMAMGKPVVSYDVSSMPEMVIHDVSGKLASYENEDDFINQVELLIKDKELRLKLGKQARELCETQFNNQLIFKQITSYLLS